MATTRKVQTMNIIISCTVAPDQSVANVRALSSEGNIADAPATGVPVVFPGTDPDLIWDGTMTGSALVSACLASLKDKYEIRTRTP